MTVVMSYVKQQAASEFERSQAHHKRKWFYSARVNHTKDAILSWRRTLLFRCIEEEIHLDISDTIQFHRFSTRRRSSGLHIRLIGARTSTRQESHFVVRLCPLWNALPLEMCSLERTYLFKSRLKALYTSRPLHAFDQDNRELTQQAGWKTQDGRMTKK